MKKARPVIIAIACICLICVGYFSFSQKNTTSEKSLTEVEKVLAKDLKRDYPKTPREVVKFYNRIVKCYYGEKLSDSQIKGLADQMLGILDEDLLLVNTKEEYYDSITLDIKKYQELNRRIVSTDVSDSNDVVYMDDKKEGSSETDKIAYVDASYFINTDGQFTNTYQQFVLRQDDTGRWKIITFYEIKGESKTDD